MIIGLTGKIGSGKSEVAKYLAEKHGFIRLNFKDALIKEVRKNFPDLLDVILAQYTLYCSSIDELLNLNPRPVLIRKLLQNYGTDVRRKDEQDYWVDKWVETLLFKGYLETAKIVTDDVRFLNEASRIRMFNGKIIKIVRLQENQSTHKSELEMDMIVSDYTIENNGSIEDLYNLINNCI